MQPSVLSALSADPCGCDSQLQRMPGDVSCMQAGQCVGCVKGHLTKLFAEMFTWCKVKVYLGFFSVQAYGP